MRIDGVGELKVLQFALVNGGNKDILVTHLTCGFEHKDGNGWSYPAQRIEFSESDSYLIHAGKAIHCKVTFPEGFTSSFAQQGKEESHGPMTLYSMDVMIDIEWILPNGCDHKKSVKILKYGFTKNGSLTMRSPLGGKKHDLYTKS